MYKDERKVNWDEPEFQDNVGVTSVLASQLPGQNLGLGRYIYTLKVYKPLYLGRYIYIYIYALSGNILYILTGNILYIITKNNL